MPVMLAETWARSADKGKSIASARSAARRSSLMTRLLVISDGRRFAQRDLRKAGKE
jgi:hypothetical protein